MTIPTSSDEVFNLVCPATSNAARGVTVPIPAPLVVVANIVALPPTFRELGSSTNSGLGVPSPVCKNVWKSVSFNCLPCDGATAVVSPVVGLFICGFCGTAELPCIGAALLVCCPITFPKGFLVVGLLFVNLLLVCTERAFHRLASVA